ncbi:MAG: anthranilate phosphoribosyltransferase [Hyphomicrobiales bacterium]
MANLKPYIDKVAQGNALTFEEAKDAFGIIMSGEATPSQIGGFLMGMRVRGETVEEISGAVSVMRAKMTPVEAPAGAIDIVGTGGDGSGTYNISTCSALVAAGAGLKIAKHGNRSLSSKSGAAEALVSLGVNIEISPEKIANCIDQSGVGFMFAPAHHAAMRFVGPTRVELGTRTIFNLLGPLSNPASTSRQIIGVFSKDWIEHLAQVMSNLGAEAVWVTHGEGGLDEITSTGTTWVSELKDGKVTSFEITPEEAGLNRSSLDDLKGGDPDYNAAAIRDILAGKEGAYRDTVLMTVASALIVSDKAKNLKDGVAQAAQSIDSGKAKEVLDKLVEASNA